MRGALAGLLVASLAACDGGGADPPDGGTDVSPDADWRVVYVVAGAAPGGDGSQARPYATLADAVRETGGIWHYRLSAGVHSLPAELTLGHGAELVGAGSTQTTLLGPGRIVLGGQLVLAGLGMAGILRLDGDATLGPEVEAVGSDLALREQASLLTNLVSLDLHGLVAPYGGTLAIADAPRAVLADLRLSSAEVLIERADDVRLSGLEVRGSRSPALVLMECSATLRDVSIEDVSATTPDAHGDALLVQGGAMSAEDVRLVRVGGRALVASGADVEITRLTVEGAGSAAAVAESSATLRIREGLLREAGTLVLTTSGGTADLRETDLADARQQCGVATDAGSHMTVSGGYVSDCPDGAFVFRDGASGGLHGALIERTVSAGCVAIVDTTDVVVARSTLRACAGSGIDVSSSTGIEVTETEVSDVHSGPVAPDTTASLLAVDSTVVFRNSRVSGGAAAGIRLLRADGQVSENVLASPGGVGIAVVGRGFAALDVAANEVSGALGIGIFAVDVAAQVANNTVSDTRWNAVDGIGDGIVFGESATVEVRANRVTGSAGNGIAWSAPATGLVDGNRVSGNAGFGLFEYCIEEEPAAVVVGTNELVGNTLGDVAGCP